MSGAVVRSVVLGCVPLPPARMLSYQKEPAALFVVSWLHMYPQSYAQWVQLLPHMTRGGCRSKARCSPTGRVSQRLARDQPSLHGGELPAQTCPQGNGSSV